MNIKRIVTTLFVAVFMAVVASAKPHTFEIGQGQFMLDGKPFVIKAAELHYARIPSAYWDHRIKMCKALGMNTICAYVFWNIHEPKPGQYDFTGDRDLARFVSLCQKNGMWVIVRPGPYACAEWEMGGLPWWLLKDKDIRLRSQDPAFIKPVVRFQREIERQLRPYKLENGGNIILLQVENEFGSYGTDKPYMAELRDSLRNIGWDKVQMFQCDWSTNFQQNALPDLLWTLNFGSGADVLKEFEQLKKLRPDVPMMCSEFWSGWFDGWGNPHQQRPWKPMVKGIGTMLDNGISFSLYMTHGGTSFGHWAGADNKGYAPDCTSYDYDAPIDEQGRATEKYYQLRELLSHYDDRGLPLTGGRKGGLPAVPKPIPVITLPQMTFSEFAPLMSEDNLPQAIASEEIQPMEQFDQGYGSILYSTTLPDLSSLLIPEQSKSLSSLLIPEQSKSLSSLLIPEQSSPTRSLSPLSSKQEALLSLTDVCDYARVYIDGQLVGQLYRGNNGESTLSLSSNSGSRLDILVEAMGRINYSKLIHDRKGITQCVELITTSPEGHKLTYDLRNWQVRLLPTDYSFVSSRKYSPLSSLHSPLNEGYYRTTFNLKKTGDTYLDLSTWGKGLVWVNGHCLGRFWQVGPQQTLYLPGCWLKKGENEIIVMDIIGPSQPTMAGLSRPIIDNLRRELLPNDAVKDALPKKRATKQELDTQGNDAAPGAK